MNFKVRCIKGLFDVTTKDKVYEIINGVFTFDGGEECDVIYKDVNELNRDMYSKFELVKEEKMVKVEIGVNKKYKNGEFELEWVDGKYFEAEGKYSCTRIKRGELIITSIFISENRAENSLEEANKVINLYGFELDFDKYNNKDVELTLEEIAEKFDVDINNLKIKK